MSRIFYITWLCSISVLLPICGHGELGSNQSAEIADKFDELIFDDAAYMLGRACYYNVRHSKTYELDLIFGLLSDDTLLHDFCTKKSLAADYFKDIPDVVATRYLTAHYLLDIALYGLIYEMTFEKIICSNPDSEEVLIFKNFLTPDEFEKAYTQIPTSKTSIHIFMFPLAIRKEAVQFVKQLTFDEAIAWLMSSLVKKAEQRDTSSVDRMLHCSSVDDWLSHQHMIRRVIMQQEQPERKALARFLPTDQELINGYHNVEFLFNAIYKPSFSRNSKEAVA